MKSAEIAAEITAIDENRARLTAQLDSVMVRIQECLPPIAESWIKGELNRQIERHPDQVQSLGVEKLRVLKDRVKALLTSLPEIAKKEIMSPKQDWPHCRTSLPQGYSDYHEPFFFNAFRDIVSHVGPMLDEFGLLKEETQGSVPSWKRVAPGKLRYSIGFVPPHDVSRIQLVQEYNRTCKEFQRVMAALEAKREELAKTKARELFESA
jgi:hypothetical protein